MKLKKWFLAFLVVIFTVITSLAIVACGDKNKPETPPETDGSELGVYYYAADGDEYQLALMSGGQFTFLFSDEYKSGTYTLEGQNLILVFTEPEEEQISATFDDNGIKLTYSDAEMRFLRKISYTVTFNSNGGSSVGSLSVINGKVFLFSVFALFVQFSEFAFCWLYLMCITFCVLFFCEKKVRKNAFRRSFML